MPAVTKPGHKTCPGCLEAKPFAAYRKDKNRTNGIDGICKKCRAKDTKSNRLRENTRWTRRRMELAKDGKLPSIKPKQAVNARAQARRHFPGHHTCIIPRCANRAELHHYLGAVREHALDVIPICRVHHAASHVLEAWRERTEPSYL
jgi:hypothetical protein